MTMIETDEEAACRIFHTDSTIELRKRLEQGKCGRVKPACRQDDWYKFDREDDMRMGLWPNEEDGIMGEE